MSLTAFRNKITSKVGRQVLHVQKHSPVLLFGAGMVGVGATVVLACRATLKVEDVLKEAEHKDSEFDAALGKELKDGALYTEEDKNKDRLTNRVKTGIKIVRLYAPAVAVGTLTVGALTGSHVILSRRNAAAVAAYGALQKGFAEYRQRVVDEFGEQKDAEFRYGVVEKEFAVDTDDGVAVKTVKVVDQPKEPSIYAVWFDEQSSNWTGVTQRDRMFLQAQQNFANDKLQVNGHVFLNEVYDSLGVPRTKAGSVVGWVKGHGDNHIDFGIFNRHDSDARAFVNGLNGDIGDVILLDFNVDGVIYDLI